MRSAFVFSAFSLAALLLSACQGPTGDASSCETFTKTFCERTGEKSAACRSMQDSAPLLGASACAAALGNIDAAVATLKEKRGPCTELVDKLCNDLGAETQSCAMVRDKTEEFPTEQCGMMLSQYPQVLASLQQQEARNKPLDEAVQKEIAAAGAPEFGVADAKVTLVLFSDFQCPYCAKAATTAEAVKEKYGKNVRFIFRQFPLPMHSDAHLAAQASLAANAQKKFWEFHDLMFENQSQLGRDALEGYAKKLGLDLNAFKAALDKGTYKDVVDSDLALGQKVGVGGTPTLFINGSRIADPTSIAMIGSAIDAAMSKAAQ